ncbi:MAG: hypothetical protein WCG75_01170 [Armatimonadota bacterium]
MSDQRALNFLPDDLTYDEWVIFIFDHPILEPNWWWWDADSPNFKFWDEEADPARTLSFLTKLFQESGQLLLRFTDWQIDQGLNYIVSNSCSNHMYSLTNGSLPWEDRKACFDAMIVLYRDLMAPVYGSDPDRLTIRVGPERPTFSCYMWWDVMPIHGGLDTPDGKMNTAILNVFNQVLQMDQLCCLESALHGLGHWQLFVGDRVSPIIERFLARTDISDTIRQYAIDAGNGNFQ